MPTENENKVSSLIDVGEANEKAAEINLDDKGEPEKPEHPAQELKDDYPEVYKASPNQSGPIKPKYVILHHSSGSHDGTRSWILNSASKVSYHYLIAADGSLTQFVYDKKRAWHANVCWPQ